MAVCNDRGAVAGNGVFSRAAAASVFDTGSGCRQLGDGISVCPLLGKGDHHRRASFKTFILYCSSLFVLWLVAVPEKLALFILFIMGWPQMITGILGLVLAYKLHKRIFPDTAE